MAAPQKLSATKAVITGTLTSTVPSIWSHVQSTQVLEQPIEFLQSLELVQTLVCAVVSTVASLRGIFPEDCFKIHRFDVENLNYSYKDFMEAPNEEKTVATNTRDKKGHRHVPWEILSRGKNTSVNKLLDWLEMGVADALSHRYLSSLQLGIYEGQVAPSTRIETYVMAFSYHENGVDMELQLSGGLCIPSQSRKTLANSKQELRYLVHRLTTHVGGFPELPNESLVQIHLTYNSTCPPGYQPPGYVDSQDHDTILGRDQGALVGSMHTGPHRVSLSIFVNEDRTEVPGIAKSGTVVTLRKLTKNLLQTQSPVENIPETEVLIESQKISPDPSLTSADHAMDDEKYPAEKDILNRIKPSQEQQNQAFTGTSIPDTQERMQLAAIATMAQLRSDGEGVYDTQILNLTQAEAIKSHGGVERDKWSPDIDASSTQGTPSPAGYSRIVNSQFESGSTVPSPSGKPLTMLRRRKRHFTPETAERSHKLQKLSKARSPFVTARLKSLRHN